MKLESFIAHVVYAAIGFGFGLFAGTNTCHAAVEYADQSVSGGGSGTVSSPGFTDRMVVASGSASYSNCSSISASQNGGWKQASSAPRDGTIVEMLQTYGVASWYGLFKYEPRMGWVSITQPHMGVSEDCLFWRPYKASGKYVDPTNGAQDTPEYWCNAMHRPFDKKTGYCK